MEETLAASEKERESNPDEGDSSKPDEYSDVEEGSKNDIQKFHRERNNPDVDAHNYWSQQYFYTVLGINGRDLG